MKFRPLEDRGKACECTNEIQREQRIAENEAILAQVMKDVLPLEVKT